MNIRQSSLFKRQFKKLPLSIQQAARNRVDLFIDNQRDTRLRVHKITRRIGGFPLIFRYALDSHCV